MCLKLALKVSIQVCLTLKVYSTEYLERLLLPFKKLNAEFSCCLSLDGAVFHCVYVLILHYWLPIHLTFNCWSFLISGEYECRLKGKNTFRQKSNRVFTFKEPPVIRIEPVKKKVRCVVGKTVKLDCSVNSPYKVEFKDISAAGKL